MHSGRPCSRPPFHGLLGLRNLSLGHAGCCGTGDSHAPSHGLDAARRFSAVRQRSRCARRQTTHRLISDARSASAKAWHHRKGGPGGSAMPFVRYLEIIMPPSDSRSLPLALVQTARLARLALPALLVLALAPAHAGAQPHQSGARAADADAPTLPLAHAPLAPQPPLPDTAVSPGNWQKAHEAVGAFPRGHADILAWERKQTAEPATRTDAGAPDSHSSHGSHGSHGKPGSAPTTQHPMHPRHHAPRSQP